VTPKPIKTADPDHAPLQHPLIAQAGTAPVNAERKRRGTEVKTAQWMLDVIIVASILFAVIPQVGYNILLWFQPQYELSWQVRDQAILFGATSNLTNIVIMLASIIFVRVLSKRLDTYDELLERGMADFERMKSRLMGWSFDLDSFSEVMDEAVGIYHTYKTEFFVGMTLAKAMLPLLPQLQQMYGKRLENFKTLTPEEQREVIRSILER
jgi:hypothetical protein